MNPFSVRARLGLALCLCLNAAAAVHPVDAATAAAADPGRPGAGWRLLDRRSATEVAIRSKSSAGPDAPDAAADSDDDSADQPPARTPARRHRRGDNDRVSVLGSVAVEAGQTVRGDAVAVLGALSVDGTVEGDAVAVLGGNTINGSVGGNAVAVLGDLTLGPTAHIRGDAVCVAGHLSRDPGAVVDGKVVQQGLGGVHPGLPMTAWWSQGLSHGRALAFGRHLAWLWVVNAVLIGFYALLALVFPGGIRRCGETLTRRPGVVVLAAFLTLLALPLIFVLLLITIVGIPVAILVLPLAILLATMFGRAAIYGLVGRAIAGSRLHASLAVMLGALIFLGLFILPAIGLVLWLLVGFVGLGVSVATLFGPRAVRAAPSVPPTPPPASFPAAAGSSAPAPASDAGVSSTAGGVGAAPPSGASGPAAVGVAGASTAAAGAEAPLSPAPGFPPPMAAPTVPPLLAAAPLASAPLSSVSSPPASGALPPSALTHPRAGFWIRTAALAVDLMLVSLIFSWCLSPLFRGFFGSKGPFLPVLAIYGAILWKVRGSTIGGIIFGLRVLRLDDRPIDWGTAVVRALACFLSLVVVGLGFIWVAFDPEKQSWHDKIAGTTVIRASKAVSLV
jgi:uncharacterized RDD family membrane protein YckC